MLKDLIFQKIYFKNYIIFFLISILTVSCGCSNSEPSRKKKPTIINKRSNREYLDEKNEPIIPENLHKFIEVDRLINENTKLIEELAKKHNLVLTNLYAIREKAIEDIRKSANKLATDSVSGYNFTPEKKERVIKHQAALIEYLTYGLFKNDINAKLIQFSDLEDKRSNLNNLNSTINDIENDLKKLNFIDKADLLELLNDINDRYNYTITSEVKKLFIDKEKVEKFLENYLLVLKRAQIYINEILEIPN